MARIRPIPVGEATDLGAATAAKLVDNGFTPGPGNPNVPPGGSPQAQAFRASQQPFAGPPEPAGFRGVQPPGGGFADRINGVAGALNDVNTRQAAAIQGRVDAATQGVKNFTTGVKNVGGAVGNLAGAVYNNPLVRVGGGVLGGISSIGDANAAQAAFDQGDNVQGVASGVRSVAGASSMLPGAAGLPGVAYMGGQLVGTGIDKGLQTFQGGRDLRDRIGSLFASPEERFKVDQANRFADSLKTNTPFAPGSMPARPAAAPAAPSALPDATLNDDLRAQRLQQAAGALGNGATNTNGLVSRQGNSFSGKNIREGFNYEDGPGSRPSTGAVSVVGNGGGYGFGPNSSLGGSDAALAAARSAAADRGDFSSVGGGSGAPTPGIGGFGGSTLSSDLRAKTDASGGTIRDLMRVGMSARQAQQAVTADSDRAERARSTDIGAGVATRGQDVGAATSRYGTDVGANVSIRGQDMTYAANKANNRLAVANAQREQANKDRDYQAGRRDADFAQRGAREQAVQRNIEAIAPVGSDGKPDANYVRSTRAALDRSAARLGVNGMHELSPRAEQQLLAAHQLLGVMKENSGHLPWQPDKLKTIDPVDLTDMRVLPNGDRQIARKDSKAMGQVIPARFFQTEEGNRFLPGTPTNRYDMLSAQGAQR